MAKALTRNMCSRIAALHNVV